MKSFIQKHGLITIFTLILLLIFFFGGMYSRYMSNQISVHAEEHCTAEITHLDYNYELSTFIESPYIVEISYGVPQVQVILYISQSFQINGVVSGAQPDPEQLTGLQLLLDEESGKYYNDTSFISYTPSTHTLVARTIGFHGAITVTVEFSSDFTTVESYLVESNETYVEESDYIGSAVPAVENYYMDGFVAGNTNLDSVAGASYGTSPAMQDLVDLLAMFQAAQTGGN